MTLKNAYEMKAISIKAEKEKTPDEATIMKLEKILREHEEAMIEAAKEGKRYIDSSVCSQALFCMTREELYSVLAPIWIDLGYKVEKISARTWRISW